MKRVAIVGAGPSGFYAAQALFKAEPDARIDLFDRLPTPYGLVRGGVAPDHQKIKSVVKAYDKVAAEPGFRFFGNVELGREIGIDDLLARYDQVVLATGAQTGRALGIPGEHLSGVHTATEFVAWYNGHPDFQDRRFPLDSREIVVVGVGNVAMDVTRVLVSDPGRLRPTDITAHALDALAAHARPKVTVLGRRGPAQASYTPKEIQEIAALDGVDVRTRTDEATLDPLSAAWLEHSDDRAAKDNAEFAASRAGFRLRSSRAEVWVRYLCAPIALLPDASGTRVGAVRVERTEVVAGHGGLSARGTGVTEDIPASFVLSAVGYQSLPVPGVPFDPVLHRIPHEEGQVMGDQGPVPDLFVVGWAKRGPTGLIGTNRGDSAATVARMQATGVKRPAPQADPADWLAQVAPAYVTWAGWERLDAAEVARGATASKIREKFTTFPDLLAHTR